MARVKVKYARFDDFDDQFASPYRIVSKSANKVVYAAKGKHGDIEKVVLKGAGFEFAKNGKLLDGTVKSVDLADHRGKILADLDGVNLVAKSLHLLLMKKNSTAFVQKLYEGNDKISVGTFESSVYTGAGNDVVRTTAQYVTMHDGPGSDTYIGRTIGNRDIDNRVSYGDTFKFKGFGAYHGVTVNLGTGRATDPWGSTDKLRNIDEAVGTRKADKLTGSNDDVHEKFFGLAGNDTIKGGRGYDEINHRLDVDYGGKRGVVINLANGTVKDGFGSRDKVSGIERAVGTKFADKIIGSRQDEHFEGWNGNDKLTGGGGSDIFRFRDGFGKDVITDFQDGRDLIRVEEVSNIFDGFKDVNVAQRGANTVITFDGERGHSITLRHFDADNISADDFLF